jgi:hypothetical protein
MARLLRYIHPHVSRYAQVDVPCRQTIILRNRVELFLTVILSKHSQSVSGFAYFSCHLLLALVFSNDLNCCYSVSAMDESNQAG